MLRQAGESLGFVLRETLSSACIDVNGARSSVKFEEFRNDRNQPRMIYDDRGAFIWSRVPGANYWFLRTLILILLLSIVKLTVYFVCFVDIFFHNKDIVPWIIVLNWIWQKFWPEKICQIKDKFYLGGSCGICPISISCTCFINSSTSMNMKIVYQIKKNPAIFQAGEMNIGLLKYKCMKEIISPITIECNCNRNISQ